MSLRFASGIKLMSHRQFNDYFEGKPIFPISIEISPSGVCDANCANCLYRQNDYALNGLDGVFFDESRMKELITELAHCGVKSINWTGGGEPTLHPSFHKFVKWANGVGIQQGLFTNGLREILYDPSLFEWIRVTKTNHPLNEKVLESMRSCKTLGICMNYSKDNTEEDVKVLLKAVERLNKLKTSPNHSSYLQIRPILLIEGETYKNDPPKISHPLLQITNHKFRGMNEKRNYKLCEGYHFTPFVWQDGLIDVCGYQRKVPGFNLGNFYKESFAFIMRNAPERVSVIDSCQVCCKLHEINSTIQIRKNLNTKDIHFL